MCVLRLVPAGAVYASSVTGSLGERLRSRAVIVAASGVVWAVAVVVASRRTQVSYGQDLQPVYDAGLAVRSGSPIYSVAHFVYPPFAAVAGVPFTLLDRHDAGHLYAVLQVVVPVLAAGLLGVALFRRLEVGVLVGGILAVALMGSDVYASALFLENISLLFVLPLVLVGICWGTGRWTLGAVILAVSVAIKPLLVLLFLMPVVRRQWRACLGGVVVAAALTGVGVALSNDLHGFWHLPAIILNGTNLHGVYQANNDSLTSIGVVHPGFRWPIDVLRVALAVAVAVTLWRSRRGPLSVERSLLLGGVLALTLPVCGGISEGHYANLALPAAVVVVRGRWGAVARWLAGIGLVDLAIPVHYAHSSVHSREGVQLHFGLGQALLLVAFLLACRQAAPAGRREVEASHAAVAAPPLSR